MFIGIWKHFTQTYQNTDKKKETSTPAAAENSRRMTNSGKFYREMIEKTKIKKGCTTEKKKKEVFKYIINKEPVKQTVQMTRVILCWYTAKRK